jgi:hypothetical protein
LQRVLGVGRRAQNPVAVHLQLGPVRVDQLAERVPVSGLCPGKQVRRHRALSHRRFPRPATDLTGADNYMIGLTQFAQAVVPGSLRILASTGDERNALLMLTVEADFGTEKATLPGARLYLLDENNKIKTEQVIFYAAQN